MLYSRRRFIRNTGFAGTGFIFLPRKMERYAPDELPTYAIRDRLTENDRSEMKGFIGKKQSTFQVWMPQLYDPNKH
jgi:hypothetical protein